MKLLLLFVLLVACGTYTPRNSDPPPHRPIGHRIINVDSRGLTEEGYRFETYYCAKGLMVCQDHGTDKDCRCLTAF